jgi:hypothetical protein
MPLALGLITIARFFFETLQNKENSIWDTKKCEWAHLLGKCKCEIGLSVRKNNLFEKLNQTLFFKNDFNVFKNHVINLKYIEIKSNLKRYWNSKCQTEFTPV